VTHSYRLAEGSLWQKLTYGGCLIAFIAFALMRFESGSSGLVFFPLLILIPFGAFAFRGIWDKRTVLTIGVEGVWFKPWNCEGPLPWLQVRKVELLTMGPGEPLVSFCLFGEDPYKLPKYSVGVAQLNVSTRVVFEVAMDYWSQFGPNSSIRRAA
jgi:hypothetical protein